MPNAKYKWLMLLMPKFKIQMTSSRKGSQIQINNKTIIEFGSRRIRRIIEASVCVICLSLRLRQITQTSALIIPHILLDLIQYCLISQKPNPIIILLYISWGENPKLNPIIVF